MSRAAAAVACVALLAAGGAAGAHELVATQELKLGWNERATASGKTVMTFEVKTLTIGERRWTVAARFRNTSTVRVTIRRDFALLVARRRDQVDGARVLLAKGFSPSLPGALAPGHAWSGTFSGGGVSALSGVYVRVQFGYFRGKVIPGREGFGWITDHAARV